MGEAGWGFEVESPYARQEHHTRSTSHKRKTATRSRVKARDDACRKTSLAGTACEEVGRPLSASHRPGERCRGQIIAGFIVDFYCHKAALVVEVDGDIHDLQQEEDARREKVLTEMGLRIVRFRNDEILSNLPVAVHKLRELVEFENLIKQARKQAKEVGLKPKDIPSAVARARGRK